MLVVLALAALPRALTMLGFRWAMWFSDSYDYLDVALHPRPDVVRPFGYPFLLMLFRPFHNVGVVTAMQHIMGLATGLLIYALLRRPHLFRGGRALPGWVAALVTVPVLFDANEIQVEHLVLSDAFFTLLIVASVTLVLWRPRPTVRAAVVAGLLLSVASVTRSVGLPLFAVLIVFLVLRRAGWRVLGAVTLAVLIPFAGYATWYRSAHGSFQVTGTDGVFLYARSMTFADCHKFDRGLPVDEQVLCTEVPPGERPVSHFYVWEVGPLFREAGPTFSPYKNDLARDFAKRAILAQPGDYARVVAVDFARTFRWDRPVYPDPKTYAQYVFPKDDLDYRVGRSWLVAQYDPAPKATRVVEPYAGVMRGYQKAIRLPGTLLGVILLVGLVGIIARWRAWGGVALLPWSLALALLVVPPATVLFDYRYVLPAVPFACLAGAIAVRDMLLWAAGRRASRSPGTTVRDMSGDSGADREPVPAGQNG